MGSAYDPSSGAGQATWHSIAELSLQIPTCSSGYSHERGCLGMCQRETHDTFVAQFVLHASALYRIRDLAPVIIQCCIGLESTAITATSGMMHSGQAIAAAVMVQLSLYQCRYWESDVRISEDQQRPIRHSVKPLGRQKICRGIKKAESSNSSGRGSRRKWGGSGRKSTPQSAIAISRGPHICTSPASGCHYLVDRALLASRCVAQDRRQKRVGRTAMAIAPSSSLDCGNILNIYGYPYILSTNCGYGMLPNILNPQFRGCSIAPNILQIFEDIEQILNRLNIPSLVTFLSIYYLCGFLYIFLVSIV